MARIGNRLNAKEMAKATERGRRYPDGNGLYLEVGRTGSRYWIFRYTRAGRQHFMGLGPVDLVTLAEARRKVFECRRQLLDKKDPLAERRRSQPQLAEMTFAECTRQYIKSMEAGWRDGGRSRDQWESSLAVYAFPKIGKMPVRDIDTDAVIRVIEPIWSTRNTTATRVRGRIEAVLAWATTRKFRTGSNPATWRNHLDKILAKPSRVHKPDHHAALPAKDVPAFLERLRGQENVSARAVEFILLTAVRAGEATGARWDEVDRGEKTWTIPASRTKSGDPHIVPLSEPALAILDHMAEIRQGDLVFPGQQPNRPIAGTTLHRTLRAIGYEGTSIHGMRASFRTWAADSTNFPREIAEASLGHKVGDEVERSYQRGSFLRKRAQLMAAWARFCSTPASSTETVVPIGAAR